ncbi:MAG TPA: U32 family peptidase [Ignavibacteriales bacterium]|nr:U32 family peptidase [Ignavibacteriales bacterium]HOL81889.1 U32 family peptidase [Ignavibacteriales bacterium]HOM65010.1 U32 family peptidase [Ignavibacteriales bacterium]HPD67258.1 U32 family peptidase [Ignavibacteriales bacterium]HPP33974.1 U32 family peptidase [Ignavibacteriales bacterium]
MAKKKTIKRPELMAPAGDWISFHTAINAGADAIYFGIDELNMRAKAKNFGIDEIEKIAKICKQNNVKSYLTLNTIIYEDELNLVEKIVKKAKKHNIDMIICWDFAVIEICKKYDMKFAISTQASIANSTAANFYKSLGASRIVLARECSLEQIKEIRKKTDLEIEVFIHGAMCISVSGRCFLSHDMFGKSANRGECIQPCRRDFTIKEYEIVDNATNKSLILGSDYILSPKDMCSIEFLDKVIEAGVDSLKIEGRKRSPEYVHKTVSIYRQAIDLIMEGKYTTIKKQEFLNELNKVYNRGFSTGFYFNEPTNKDYANAYGSIASTRKEYIGKVTNYFKKVGVAEIKIETGELNLSDNIYIMGNDFGTYEFQITSLMVNDEPAQKAQKGDIATFKIDKELKRNLQIYKIVENKK